MRARLRQPLFWIVIAEVVVMFVLFAVSWRVFQSPRGAPVAATPPLVVAPAPTDAPLPEPGALPTPPAARPPAAPAVGFPVNLGRLNSGQAALEKVEDSILSRLLEAMRGYIEAVVLPAVRRAESERTATSPAAAQRAAAMRKMPWYSATRA